MSDFIKGLYQTCSALQQENVMGKNVRNFAVVSHCYLAGLLQRPAVTHATEKQGLKP